MFRILLDTCVLNILYDEGEYIFDGYAGHGRTEQDLHPDLRALRVIFRVNERANFELVVSPISVAEVANVQDFPNRERRVRWLLDVLDHWLVMLDQSGHRQREGGTVRHRFKLSPELQAFESRVMAIPDFRRDPIDRLLLVQYRMADCDIFLTKDSNTILRHRKRLRALGVRVLRPAELLGILGESASAVT